MSQSLDRSRRFPDHRGGRRQLSRRSSFSRALKPAAGEPPRRRVVRAPLLQGEPPPSRRSCRGFSSGGPELPPRRAASHRPGGNDDAAECPKESGRRLVAALGEEATAAERGSQAIAAVSHTAGTRQRPRDIERCGFRVRPVRPHGALSTNAVPRTHCRGPGPEPRRPLTMTTARSGKAKTPRRALEDG